MKTVVVLATGGTIASVSNADGGAVAAKPVAQLLSGDFLDDTRLEARDVMNTGSYLMRFSDMRVLAEAAHRELARDDVAGVVITHGTDTLEESSMLLEAVHTSPKPVVFTGAQRAADHPSPDGPANLRQAIRVASSPASCHRGVLLVFASEIFAVPGTRKIHTVAPQPFRTGGAGPVGYVSSDSVSFFSSPERRPPLPLPTADFDDIRIDVVSVYPGSDAALCQAAEGAGCQAVILLGTGSGNGNQAVLSWVKGATERGLVVGLSTRVPDGPVIPLYGRGGAVDLVQAGAVLIEDLPATQARVLMALLFSHGEEVTADALSRGLRA